MAKLADKTALITGAGGSIGRAAALLFASQGASVAVVDLDGEAAGETVAMIAEEGGEALALTADVSNDQQIRAAVDRAAETFGGLAVIYNNAGVDSRGSVADATEADWDRCFAVNVKGTFLTSRAAIPHLRKAAGASIINQASVAGLVGVGGMAAYGAAKGALVALTRSMAVDLASMGIRVNVVCPGTVHTPLIEPLLRQRGGGDLERGMRMTTVKYPIGRLGKPEEIAQAALFLASDDASFVTGSVWAVDGGMTAQ